MVASPYLRRYTDVPALLYLLRERKLTLLDPALWDDKNDAHYMALYKEKTCSASVLAVCFSQCEETYHHWRVFAGGSSGVCIRFKRSALLRAIKAQPDVHRGAVRYLTLSKIRNRTLAVGQLPFLKRYAFEHEDEYRLVYRSTNKPLRTLDIPIPLATIDRITLSPWIHPALASHLKETLWAIDGCSSLPIYRSTLISNQEWKSLGEAARE